MPRRENSEGASSKGVSLTGVATAASALTAGESKVTALNENLSWS